MNRRKSLKLASGVAALALIAPTNFAQTTDWEIRDVKQGKIPFALPAVPYPHDALEPFIDAATLKTHHDERHGEYVTALNKAIGEVIDLYIEWKYKDHFTEKNGETLVSRLNALPEKVKSPTGERILTEELRNRIRQAAGGHYNHSLFWQMMRKGGGAEPTGELAVALKKKFGSFAAFKKQFTKTAVEHPGNGWAWLTLDAGELKLEALPNEDSPLSMGRPVLLGVDLWEHAYQAQYGKNRAAYVAAWFNVVNWDFVAERYSRLRKP